MLTRYFGAGAAGDYGLGNRILNTPLSLVSTSVGQVFFQESSDINNQKGNLQNLVKDVYKRLFKIGIVPIILVTIFAPFLFKLFFGQEYHSSAQMVQIIIPWVFLGFLTQPVSTLFTVLKKQKFMFFINLFVLALRFSALYLGYYFYNNVLVSVLFYAIIGVLFNIFQLFYFLNISKENVSY
jgi:O-antigen/teichoic acid export membrane protein